MGASGCCAELEPPAVRIALARPRPGTCRQPIWIALCDGDAISTPLWRSQRELLPRAETQDASARSAGTQTRIQSVIRRVSYKEPALREARSAALPCQNVYSRPMRAVYSDEKDSAHSQRQLVSLSA
jgi:hypothetical protein